MIRVFTTFSGYDSQCLALNVLEEDSFFLKRTEDGRLCVGCKFEYELIGWSEIDKYAIKAHNALFPQWADRNYGDISKIDWANVPDFDLFTYSSPCQDFSQAGKRAGGAKGSGTRSSLLWECERAIEIKRPKYLLFETASTFSNKKNIRLLEKWQAVLNRLGYTNFAQVCDSKEIGYPTPIPQHRERLFMVSILNCTQPFYFPDKSILHDTLNDYLEKDVDAMYYLSKERLQGLRLSTEKEKNRGNRFAFQPKGASDIANTITTREGTRKGCNYIKVVGNLNLEQVFGKGARQQNIVVSADGISPTITHKHEMHPYKIAIDEDYMHIRKLTPRECFRLMGVCDIDIDTIQSAGISRTRQVQLAGNSIVVNTLAAILRQLFIGNFNKVIQTEIF